MPALHMGFWGATTSTVDWCETNYEHLSYVCELFNSVSSLAMVLAGVVGILLHRHVLERRFQVAFAMQSARSSRHRGCTSHERGIRAQLGEGQRPLAQLPAVEGLPQLRQQGGLAELLVNFLPRVVRVGGAQHHWQ